MKRIFLFILLLAPLFVTAQNYKPTTPAGSTSFTPTFRYKDSLSVDSLRRIWLSSSGKWFQISSVGISGGSGGSFLPLSFPSTQKLTTNGFGLKMNGNGKRQLLFDINSTTSDTGAPLGIISFQDTTGTAMDGELKFSRMTFVGPTNAYARYAQSVKLSLDTDINGIPNVGYVVPLDLVADKNMTLNAHTFTIGGRNGSDTTGVTIASTIFDASTSDGSTSGEIGATANNSFSGVFENSTSNQGFLSANVAAGNTNATMEVVAAGANSKIITMDVGTGAHDGIVIHDAVTHVGLIGDQVFPLSGSGAQYAQYHKVDSLIAAAGGGGISALTGDVTASGTGSVAATLATVNSNVGSFGDATHVAAVTVNAKGLTTAVASTAITFPVTLTNSVALTNKDLTGAGNTFPTFNQNTSGTAANLSGTPALPNGTTATTQTVGDNSTKLATTAFVLANAGGSGGLLAANNLSDVASMETSRQNLGIQDIWKRKGIVVYPSTTADQQTNGEPTVIYEGSPQILTTATNVFKMWYTQGWASPNIMYAESLDGVSWVKRSTACVTGRNRSFVLKNSTTYYMYCANIANSQLDQFTSTDGITWTLAHSAVVTSAGFSWSGVYSPFVFIESGTWKMIVDCQVGGNYCESYLTSTDGITWTTPAGVTNPVISTFSAGNPYVLKVGSTYYLFGHGTGTSSGTVVPNQIYIQSSPDLKTWSAATLILARRTADEGASLPNAQISDISVIQVGNSLYLYYTSTPDGTVQTGIAHIKLAVANMTLAQFVTTSGGDGGDIVTQQPPFVYDPSSQSLTYTSGNQNNSFSLAAPLYPNLNLVSNGTQFGQIGSGNSSIFTGATDLNIIANASGNMSIEATSMVLSAPTFRLPKTGSFGATSALSNGNWNFNSSTGVFQFYFNFKGSSTQQFIMTVAANQLSSPQNSNDFIFSNTGRMAFATSGSTQAAEFAVFDPSDKTLQLNRGLSTGFTTSKAALQTTSFSTGITATAKTTTYTATLDDHTITGDATSAGFTITLPTAVGSQGIEYVIKKIDSSGNAVTVGTSSSQTIDGSTTYALSAQWKYVRVQSNNVNWIVVGNN